MANIEMPKSLTAVVHLRFNYEGIKDKPMGQGELETLNKLMDQAYDLPVDLQEILVKFGTYLKRESGAEPTGK
ncbi:hypothetical protein LCGC14_0262230 [marine sediment metagenome]|uniref:Uncharacterized protein n=1 Tax=marine sediment metagenome TaxID=412755 RepID=A0A0F9U5S1_9ZZZZ